MYTDEFNNQPNNVQQLEKLEQEYNSANREYKGCVSGISLSVLLVIRGILTDGQNTEMLLGDFLVALIIFLIAFFRFKKFTKIKKNIKEQMDLFD